MQRYKTGKITVIERAIEYILGTVLDAEAGKLGAKLPIRIYFR